MKVSTSLSKLAKEFGYNLETDPYDDVFHDGFRRKDVQNTRLPADLEGAEKVFWSSVASAIETLEREAIAEKLRKNRIDNLVEALEKIDVGHAEYQDLEGRSISEPAHVISAEADQANDLIHLEIKNPHHLINAIVSGVGLFHPDIPSDEEPSVKEIESRIHHLVDFFKVWGESIPTDDEVRDWDSDDERFNELLRDELDSKDEDSVVEDVIEAIERYGVSAKEALDIASRITKMDRKVLKNKIIEKKDEELKKLQKDLESSAESLKDALNEED